MAISTTRGRKNLTRKFLFLSTSGVNRLALKYRQHIDCCTPFNVMFVLPALVLIICYILTQCVCRTIFELNSDYLPNILSVDLYL